MACRADAIEPGFRIWLEAKFLGAPVSAAVENAQRTVRAGGYWEDGKLIGYTKKEWGNLNLKWETFEKKAREKSSEDFRTLQVAYKRDNRMVIEYAELTSDDGVASSAVLAPEFGEKFEDTLGEVLLLAVPSRTRVIVFPQLGTDISRYSEMVLSAYRETSHPVSVEVFEWRKGKIRAVGVFER
jgi:uncharacterized protein YtpQ (UPF0354 family)